MEDENEHNISHHSYRNPNRFEMKPRTKYDVKLIEDRKYKAPHEYVRNRINSEYLQFMNYQEIEQISKANLEEITAKMEAIKV